MPTIIDCPTCNRRLRVAEDQTDRVQCPSCGATFAPAAAGPPESASRTRCPICHEDIAASAEICPACGENVRDERPPWERPGAIRRDCLPHRGNLVLGLGVSGLVAGSIPYFFWLGLPLSLTAWILGQKDLRRIRTNVMDPMGRGTTQAGMICGIIGSVLSTLWLVGVVLVFGLFLYRF